VGWGVGGGGCSKREFKTFCGCGWLACWLCGWLGGWLESGFSYVLGPHAAPWPHAQSLSPPIPPPPPPQVKNIDVIQLGQHEMHTWYFSPFPPEYNGCKKLYFCEYRWGSNGGPGRAYRWGANRGPRRCRAADAAAQPPPPRPPPVAGASPAARRGRPRGAQPHPPPPPRPSSINPPPACTSSSAAPSSCATCQSARCDTRPARRSTARTTSRCLRWGGVGGGGGGEEIYCKDNISMFEVGGEGLGLAGVVGARRSPSCADDV
jgi:hypothetical protein